MNSRAYRGFLTLVVCLVVSGGMGIGAFGQQRTDRPEILPAGVDSGTRDSISLKLLAASEEAEVKKEPEVKNEAEVKKDPGAAASQDRSASPSGELGGASTKEAPEIQKLKEQIIDLQNKGKLGFRKVVLCNSIEGFGLYSPFETGQPLTRILLYLEPSNVSTLVSEGRFIVDLAVDVFLLDGSGKVIGGKQNILKINKISRSPILDLYYKLEMKAKKPLKGEIVMKTVLHDRMKNQSASTTYKINMGQNGAKPLLPI
jgi:hypothetical protein